MAFQTIIQFAYIEFDKNWDQVPGGLYFWYTASADAQLLVLREGSTGLKTTYTFKLPRVPWSKYRGTLTWYTYRPVAPSQRAGIRRPARQRGDRS